jgi:peroxiredoxin
MRYFINTTIIACGLLSALLAWTLDLARFSSQSQLSIPTYGSKQSMGGGNFSSKEDTNVLPPRSHSPLYFVSLQTQSDNSEQLAQLSTELTQLKKQRPKNAADFQQQQRAIQELATRAMHQIDDPKSQMYLQFEREGLLASTLLIQRSSAENNLPSETELASVEPLLTAWAQYAKRRQTLDLTDLRLISSIAKHAENNCHPQTATRVYEFFLQKIRQAQTNTDNLNGAQAELRLDPKSQDSYKQLDIIFTGTLRRLDLVGSPMLLTGKSFDGADFNLDTYRGKVVLVDYWATWCGPCVAEYPQIRSLWEKYHTQGFEVVGVSMDADRESLANYLREKSVPWVVLNDEQQGGKHPSTEYYSIQTVPAMFLIGRDGKVISTQVEVPKLEPLLQKALQQP